MKTPEQTVAELRAALDAALAGNGVEGTLAVIAVSQIQDVLFGLPPDATRRALPVVIKLCQLMQEKLTLPNPNN